MGLLVEALEAKARRLRELGDAIGEGAARRALRDGHALRRPRPCGITVHTGIGCSYRCAYCYIYDMGFPAAPAPYPLTGGEVAYALAANPHVAVGPWGTLVAVGSVTEPFMPLTKERALEYVGAIAGLLGNPIQISTKGMLGPGDARRLAGTQGGLDVLVTVTTLERHRLLEPYAPPPMERLEMARELVGLGIHVTLFVRPMVPGVTDREVERILAAARDAGIDAVVFGTLRATRGIARRLASLGVDLSGRLRGPPGRGQTPILSGDIKRRAIDAARRMGLKVLPASCSANVVAHGQACAACDMGPCGDMDRLPRVGHGDVAEYLEARGIRAEAHVEDARILVRGRLNAADVDFMAAVTRRRVVVQK